MKPESSQAHRDIRVRCQSRTFGSRVEPYSSCPQEDVDEDTLTLDLDRMRFEERGRGREFGGIKASYKSADDFDDE